MEHYLEELNHNILLIKGYIEIRKLIKNITFIDIKKGCALWKVYILKITG